MSGGFKIVESVFKLLRRRYRSQFEWRVTSVLIIQLREQLLQHQNSLFLLASLESGWMSDFYSMYSSLHYNMICSASLCVLWSVWAQAIFERGFNKDDWDFCYSCYLEIQIITILPERITLGLYCMHQIWVLDV